MLMKFFVGVSFAILFTPSIENVKLFEKQCKNTAEKIDECWVKYSDLPECESSDPLVVCGQDASQKMHLCEKGLQKRSKNVVRNYEIIHEAVCDDAHMRDEFEKKPACWYTARNCAMKLLNETITAVDLDSYDCKVAIDKAANCSSFDTWCTELHENLTAAAYEKSECGNISPEKEKSVSSAQKLYAFHVVLLSIFVLIKSYLE